VCWILLLNYVSRPMNSPFRLRHWSSFCLLIFLILFIYMYLLYDVVFSTQTPRLVLLFDDKVKKSKFSLMNSLRQQTSFISLANYLYTVSLSRESVVCFVMIGVQTAQTKKSCVKNELIINSLTHCDSRSILSEFVFASHKQLLLPSCNYLQFFFI
jgi:hypothetical protein